MTSLAPEMPLTTPSRASVCRGPDYSVFAVGYLPFLIYGVNHTIQSPRRFSRLSRFSAQPRLLYLFEIEGKYREWKATDNPTPEEIRYADLIGLILRFDSLVLLRLTGFD